MLVTFTITMLSVQAQRNTMFYVLSDDQPSAFNQCQATKNCTLVALLSNNILSNISNIEVILHPGIHTINSTVNQVFHVSNVATFTLKAANLNQHATIMCKGKTGFAFTFSKNLTIHGINFESCSGRHVTGKTLFTDFTLFIRHSFDVNISSVVAKNSGGIGLLVINVCGLFMVSNSVFTNNTCNVCYFSTDKDSMNFTSRNTDIIINNSKFEWATTCSQQNPLNDMGTVHSAGLVLQLFQTTFKIRTLLSNITLIKNEAFSIAIDFIFPTNKLKIENITSTSLNDKFGMLIHPLINSSVSSSSYDCETAVVVNHAQLKQSRLFITNIGKSKSCILRMVLSNIFIDEVYYGQKYPLFVTGIPSIVMRNVIVQNTIGTVSFVNCNLQLQGWFTYQQNRGSIVLIDNKVDVHNTVIIIRNNTANHFAPCFIVSSEISVKKVFINIKSNTGPETGGIIFANSTVTFTNDSQVVFLYNTGQQGGAMAFHQRSKLRFLGGMTNFTYIGNYASAKGGAIYVHDEEYVKYNYIVLPNYKQKRYENFVDYIGGHSSFHFFNNYAAQAGSAVFGGSVNDNFHFHNSSVNDTSIVSSIPFKVCMCTNSKPNCSIVNTIAELQPGQSHTMEVTAVGQRYGTVHSTIKAKFIGYSKGQLTQIQYIQPIDTACTNLTYTVKFSKDTELLQLTTTDQTWERKIPLNITFHRKDCTIGFILDTERNKCICSQIILDHGMECDIQTLRINRLNPKWISSTYMHLNLIVRLPGVIVHDYCPYDYCIATSQSLDLQYPDQQCDFNRSGILCGGCKTNYSHVLGTSKCKQCTKHWMALIIPLIAIAGAIFVASLMVLNITVSVGAINGLIFYANVVRANHSIFFPHDASTSFLSTFIAWLNLDLGIEVCFYSGLDAYSKTWFQFLFPLYIWFILSTIIVVSHCSTQISRLVGNNAVQVLATLFLLSYAKLLQIIIIVFSSTELVYPDGYHRRVWLYDGNIDYLNGKHLLLFLAALLLLICISFPFTTILFCIQCMQRLSNKRVLSWVGKLQPLFDAYTGPYKIKHRYWTGLLLLIRVCLFLVFSLNTFGNPMINLLTVCITMSCLLAYLSLIGGVYKLWWLSVIETAFILNLLILSSAGFYQINTGTTIKPITYTSTGITLVLFISIFIYHIVLKVTKTKFGQKTKLMLTNHHHLLTKLKSDGPNELKIKCSRIRLKSKDEVTYSEVKLEESLLEGI